MALTLDKSVVATQAVQVLLVPGASLASLLRQEAELAADVAVLLGAASSGAAVEGSASWPALRRTVEDIRGFGMSIGHAELQAFVAAHLEGPLEAARLRDPAIRFAMGPFLGFHDQGGPLVLLLGLNKNSCAPSMPARAGPGTS